MRTAFPRNVIITYVMNVSSCVSNTLLQSLTGESFPLRSANTDADARLDVKAQNFRDKSKQSTFFDVRIFNSHTPSNCTTSTDACYRRHEREKRRAYEQRILEVEHGTFTPLVLFASGGNRLIRLPSRDLQVSSLRNTINRTGAPSTLSDVRSPSV